jgi:hypothetical protein
MKFKPNLMILWLFLGATLLLAQGQPPPAGEVAATVQNFWASRQFSQLENYVANLYSNYPNYVPAILVKAGYDAAYKNDVPSVIEKLNRVASACTQTNFGSDIFCGLLLAEKGLSEEVLSVYNSEGISHEALTNAASVEAARNAADSWPYLAIISNAPSLNLPNN